MSRVDQWRNTVTIDGESLGVFDTFDGGAADSEEQKYRPGGMDPEITLGGSSSFDNVTIARLYVHERDHDLCRRLMNKAGRATVVVKRQPLDKEGNAFGTPHVYNGTLKACTPPGSDSQSSDPAQMELECTVVGAIG
jgi:hypothetical protein